MRKQSSKAADEVTVYFLYDTGLTPQLVITILSAIESTKKTAETLDWLFIAILPNYNMGQGVSGLYNNYDFIDLCYNKFPDSLNRSTGKESLEEICDQIAEFNGTFSCCKGTATFLQNS